MEKGSPRSIFLPKGEDVLAVKLCVGSVYHFVGELAWTPSDEATQDIVFDVPGYVIYQAYEEIFSDMGLEAIVDPPITTDENLVLLSEELRQKTGRFLVNWSDFPISASAVIHGRVLWIIISEDELHDIALWYVTEVLPERLRKRLSYYQ